MFFIQAVYVAGYYVLSMCLMAVSRGMILYPGKCVFVVLSIGVLPVVFFSGL